MLEQMSEAESCRSFLFVGNALWLDFINTQIVQEDRPIDLLADYSDFIAWLRQAGILTVEEAEVFAQRWEPEGKAVLEQAHSFRRTLRTLAVQMAAGDEATYDNASTVSAIKEINDRLRHSPAYQMLVRTETVWQSVLRYDWKQPEDLFAPIVESAADLLANGDPALVRKCENPACILFFYDTTKNHARRWCSMSGCGNRMKQAAHYRRSRASA